MATEKHEEDYDNILSIKSMLLELEELSNRIPNVEAKNQAWAKNRLENIIAITRTKLNVKSEIKIRIFLDKLLKTIKHPEDFRKATLLAASKEVIGDYRWDTVLLGAFFIISGVIGFIAAIAASAYLSIGLVCLIAAVGLALAIVGVYSMSRKHSEDTDILLSMLSEGNNKDLSVEDDLTQKPKLPVSRVPERKFDVKVTYSDATNKNGVSKTIISLERRCWAYIGIEDFAGAEELISIEIPDGITSIDDLAFEGCTSLTSMVLPDSLTHFSPDACITCENLTSITINAKTPENYLRILALLPSELQKMTMPCKAMVLLFEGFPLARAARWGGGFFSKNNLLPNITGKIASFTAGVAYKEITPKGEKPLFENDEEQEKFALGVAQYINSPSNS